MPPCRLQPDHLRQSTHRRVVLLATILLLLIANLPAMTDIPSIIGSGMVLQRERNVPLWGWDNPGTTIRISFRGSEVATTTAADGRWEGQIASGLAGGPFTLVISGSSQHELTNVLVGEVWIAGGQSNMWWQLRNCTDGELTVAAADQPMLRWYDANTGVREAGWPAPTPQRTIATRWQTSHPSVAADFAGTAYACARRLQATLGIPVGIVHLAVPGTAIEQWLGSPILHDQFQELQATNEQRRALHARDETAPAALGHADLFNGMVAPCAPFAVRGFLWWQGEGNSADPSSYQRLFPALITTWRTLFRDPQAPFLFVELANFGTAPAAPIEDAPWPALRDAQRSGLALPRTAMVCALDILDSFTWEIHPPRKDLAGERLYRAAMALAYGSTEEWSGPQPTSYRFDPGAARVTFSHADGLQTRGDPATTAFAIAGIDRVWHAATARIDGQTVVLRASGVASPAAVRYAWFNNPKGSLLTNSSGLPACAFRSDDWPLAKAH